jgi:hypothetical protein
MEMAFKVHHAVAKKAAKLGITFETDGFSVIAMHNGKEIATGDDATKALAAAEKALAALNPKPAKVAKPRRARDEEDEGYEDEDEAIYDEEDEGDDGLADGPEEAEADDEEGDEENGKSVVKKTYKRKYRPTKNKNGDEISFLITEHVAERGEDGEILKPVRTDEEHLKRFAIANGVWNPDYAHLNVGMRRMNIGNRLRAKVKKDHEIVWAK